MNLYYRFPALVLVLNLVVAVAVGLSTSIFTQTSTPLSVVLALVSLTLGIVLDIRLALAGERELVRFILGQPAIVAKAWDIFHSLEGIRDTHDPFLSKFADAELERAAAILKRMAAGSKEFRVSAPSVQETWAYLFDAAAKGEEVVAVSAITTTDWWAGDRGTAYIASQKLTVARGVVIKRIMILRGNTNNDATPEEKKAMRQQDEAGVPPQVDPIIRTAVRLK